MNQIGSFKIIKSLKRTFWYVALVCVVLSSLGPATPANAAIPKYINFQGKLTKVSDGTNVSNGTYAFQFKLYDASTSGTLLWTETYDQPSGACGKLTVTNAIFNAKLGSCASLSGVDFTGGSLYLSVNFAPTGTSYDGEMSPRKQLVASPFAFIANGVSGDGKIDIANTGTNQATIGYDGTNKLQVNVGSTGFTTLTANGAGAGFNLTGGNVGIGTSGPGALLQINSTVGGVDPLILRDATNSANARFYFTSPLGSPADLNISAGRVIFPGYAIKTGRIEGNSNLVLGATNGSVAVDAASSFTVTTTVANTVIFSGGTSADTIIRPYSSSYNIQLAPNGGNVGIGTTTPAQKLEVAGNIRVNDASDNQGFIFANGGTDRFKIYQNGTILNFASQSGTLGQTFGFSGGTMDGTTGGHSATLFNISGTWNQAADTLYGLKLNVTDTNAGAASKLLDIQKGGTSQFNVDKNGNVGVGTTSATQKLQVAGNGLFDVYGSGDGNGIFFRSGFTYNMGITARDWSSSNLTSDGLLVSAYDGIGFMTQSNTYDSTKVRLLIQQGGNVGIGTTSPLGPLHVATATGVNNVSYFSGNDVRLTLDGQGINNDAAIRFSYGGSPQWQIGLLGSSVGATGNLYFNRVGGGTALTINTGGNIGIGTTTAGSLLTVGTSGGFTVNGSGAVTAATGITSSGTITFSGLSAGGVVQATAGTGALTVGTLGVSSGGTGATSLTGILIGNGTSAFTATTASSGIAGQITDETGSGALVFGTSPTLATPTFTTSATGPLLIGGTGTTSTLTLRSTSGVGTTGADIIFQTGNNGATEAMRILNNGNVGIGTTGASVPLAIGAASYGFGLRAGQALDAYINGVPSLDIQAGSVTLRSGQNLAWASSDDASQSVATRLSRLSDGKISVDTTTAGNSLGTLIAGNIGIGTTSPAHKLDVYGNGTTFRVFDTGNSDQFLVRTGSGGIGYSEAVLRGQGQTLSTYANPQGSNQSGTYATYSALSSGIIASGNLVLGSSNAERVRIENTTGNVGIGTTTISAKLHSVATTEQLRLGYDTSNYTSFTTSSGGDLTIAPSGGNVILADTVTLNVGGIGAVAYNAFGDSAVAVHSSITGDDDLYVEDNAQVAGSLFIGNSVSAGSGITTPLYVVTQHGGGIRLHPSGATNTTWAFDISDATTRYAYLNFDQQAGNLLQLANNSSGSLNITTARASGGTTTSAFNIKTTTDLAAADELFQVGDSTADFLTVLGNGNVGIGTTSPAALLDVANTIQITGGSAILRASGGSLTLQGGTNSNINLTTSGGSLIIANGGYLRGVDGAVGTPTYSFNSDPNTGIYSGGADILKISTGGADRVTVNAGGNVGIGTTSPAELLHVAGDIMQQNTRTRTMTRTIPTTVNDAVDIGSFVLSQGAGSLWVSITSPNSTFSVAKEYLIPIKYGQTSNTWAITPATSSTGSYSGNDFDLDINVNGAVAALRIRRTSGSTPGTAYIVIRQDGVNTDSFTASTATASVAAPTTYFTSTALTQVGGNVGIGTTAPAYKLHLPDPGNTQNQANIAGTIFGSDGNGPRLDFSGTNSTIYNGANNYLYFSSSTGVTIGTGAVTNPGSRLSVKGNLSVGATYAAIAAPTNGAIFEGNVGIGTTAVGSLLTVGTSGGFTVNTSGAVTAATGITSSGTITFSGLSAGGVVQATAGTGVLTVGTLGASAITADALDFSEFKDAMTLDASTDIAVTGSNVFSITNSGSGNSLVVNDQAADTTPFVIDAAGNVGIGTTSAIRPLYVSSTNVGVLGIDGPVSPLQTFHIAGSQFATLGSAAGALTGGTATDLALQTSTGGSIQFATNGTALSNIRMTIASGGNVGIGTTSPAAKLAITGTGTGSGKALSVFDSGNVERMSVQDNGSILIPGYVSVGNGNTCTYCLASNFSSTFGINNTNAVNGNRNSSFGFNNTVLGATSSSRISLFGSDNTTASNATIYANVSAFGYNNTISATTGASIFGHGITNAVDNSTMIGPSDSAKITILSSGNVGIGTTSPTYTLHIAPTNAIANQTAFIQDATATTGSTRLTIKDGAGQSSSASLVFQNNSGTAKLSIGINLGGGNPQIAVPSGESLRIVTTDTIFQSAGDSSEIMRVRSTGNVGIGTASPDALLELAGNRSQSAWGLNGIALQGTAATYTDSSTAISGTATNAAISSFGQPTLAATNTSVTTTNAFTQYIAGAPISGTNQTLTNTTALYIAGTATTDGAGGTPTNSYGLYVNAQTGATNNYAAVFAGGNVGIGTTAPSGGKLDIANGNSSADYQNLAQIALGFSSGGYRNYITTDHSGTGGSINFYTSDGSLGGTLSTATLNVSMNRGNVGIGTTAPAAKLTVGSGTPTTAANGLNFGTDTSANLYRSAAATIKTDGTFNAVGGLQVNGANINTAGTLNNVAYLNQANTFSTGQTINPGSAVTALSITQSYNATGINISKAASGAAINISAASAQASGVVIALTDATTSLMNAPTYGVSSVLSTGYDNYSTTAGNFSATQTRTTAGSNADLAIGVDATATSSIATAGTYGYAGRFTAGSANITPLLVKGASSQTSDLFQIQNSGGTGLLTVNSNGNVGVGSTSPSDILDISKNQNTATRIKLSNTTAGTSALSEIRLYSDAETSGFAMFSASSAFNSPSYVAGVNGFFSNTSPLMFATNAAQPITFRANASEAMRITSAGNVGIGSTTPGTTLDVTGTFRVSSTSTFNQQATFNNANIVAPGITSSVSNFQIVRANSGTSVELLGGAASFKLDKDIASGGTGAALLTGGNLGIGTTTAGSLLTVGSTGGFTVNTSGAVTAATGITSSGIINFSGLTASSLVFTDGSKNLTSSATSSVIASSVSDETGSGALVFATSPTLTTPNIGAATGTSLALSGAITGATGFNGLVVTANTGVITTGTWQGTAIGATYGGTGLNTSASTGVPSISSGTWSVNAQLPVSLGGTGAATFTANGVLFGNGTSAIQATAAGTTGQCLIGNTGAAPSWGSCGGTVRLDQIAAANTTATIANGSNAIVWNWGSLTTQTGMTFGGGSAMTTGSVFAINSSTYTHTTTETGSAASIAFTDTSTNTTGTGTTNGLLVTPTINTSASAGTKVINGVSVTPTLTACGTTGGTCTLNNFNSTTPSVTQSTTNTLTINGSNLGTAGALVQNTAAGTINWNGQSVTNPNITQTTGSVTANGLNIATGTITTGGTQRGINIAATGVSAGTLNGLSISSITGGSGSETALVVGGGWDNVLIVNGTTILNGSGVVQSAAISGSYTGITGVGTVTAGTWNATAIGATYGGTGINTAASTGVPSISSGTWSVNAQLPVSLGGTGAATLTGVLIGNGTSAVTGATTSSGISGALSDETGSGSLVFATSPTLATPTFTTSATGPLFIGGTGTTSTLSLRSTSGVGTTGADILFQTGNNGATEAMRILNNGNVGIGDASPAALFTVGSGDLFQVNSSGAIAAATGITSSGTINFSGLTASSAVYTDGSKNLTSTAPTSGTIGYWSRSGTTLQPATSNDVVAISSNAVSAAGVLDITASGTITSGNNAVRITANSVTTGTGINLSATGVTTGSALVITGPSSTGVTTGTSSGLFKVSGDVGSAGTAGILAYLAPDFSASSITAGYGMYINGTDATSTANVDVNFGSNLALTGNAAKTAYAGDFRVTSTSTTADSIYAGNFTTSVSGAISTGTRNMYGGYFNPATNAASTGGTTNIYGGYFYPSGTNATTGATVNVYGGYFTNNANLTTGGTVNGYGLYVANGNMNTTGTSTQYGIYVAAQSGADNNYAAVFAGGNVGIGTTAPGYLLQINAESDQIGFRNAAGSQLAGRLGRDSSGGMILNADLGSLILNAGSSADGISLLTNNTNKHITLQPTGNVGIGTATPTNAKLEVVSTATTGTTQLITATSTTTGAALSVVGSSTTGVTGSGLFKVTGDVGSGGTQGILAQFQPDYSAGSATNGYGVTVVGTDSTAVANSNTNLYSNLTLTGNAAKAGYASYNAVTTNSTTADNTYAGLFSTTASGAISTGTRNTFGVFANPSSTGANTGGTTQVFGSYSVPSSTGSTTGSTVNVFGNYIQNTATLTTGGTITSYGMYIANGSMNTTGTSTQYGLYVAAQSGADNNYAAYFGGNVGIGTTAPTYALDVSAASTVTAAFTATAIGQSIPLQVFGPNASNGSLGPAITLGKSWAASSSAYIGYIPSATAANNLLTFGHYGAADLLTVAQGGNVGVGTTNALSKLYVAGNLITDSNVQVGTGAGASLQVVSNVNGGGITLTHGTTPIAVSYNITVGGGSRMLMGVANSTNDFVPGSAQYDTVLRTTNQKILFSTDNGTTAHVTINTSGNVGIGTSTPSALLHIKQSTNGQILGAIENVNTGTTAYAEYQARNGTGDTDALRMMSMGTSWTTTGPFVQDAGVLVTDSGLSGGLSIGTRTTADVRVYTNSTQVLTAKNGGVIQFNTYGAGTLTTDGSGNITASSDARLKTLQGEFTAGLAQILNIHPALYKWNDISGMETNGIYAGFVAQDIQNAIPEAVSTDSRGYLTLSDRPIIAASINAIKELNGIVVKQSSSETITLTTLVTSGIALEVKTASTSLLAIDYVGTARFAGTVIVKKDVAVLGRVLGSTAIVAKNTSNQTIHQGDLVMLTGATDVPALGDNPTITVSPAIAGTGIIVGIADRNLADFNLDQNTPAVSDPTEILPGEFMSVVITGTYKKAIVDGPVAVGDKLTASTTPGHVAKLEQNAAGQMIGISLDAAPAPDGSIRIMILSGFQAAPAVAFTPAQSPTTPPSEVSSEGGNEQTPEPTPAPAEETPVVEE